MRVTQNMLYSSSITGLQSHMQELKRVQEQSVSGVDVGRPSDNPSATFLDLVLGTSLEEVESRRDMIDVAKQRVITAETKLSVFHDIFLDAYESALQMGNDYQHPDDLKVKGEVVAAYFDDMLSEANTDIDGVPLFSGGRTAIPYDVTTPKGTAVSYRVGGTGALTDDLTGALYSVTSVTPGNASYPGIPSSVKMTYDGVGNFSVQVDGNTPTNVAAAVPGPVNLGWATVQVNAAPGAGDVLFFDVVPTYQGGLSERPVQLKGTQTFPANLTGNKVFEGVGGRQINLFGELAGLKGALLRGDPGEVSERIDRLENARTQIAEVQSVTGLRAVRLESASSTLHLEGDSIKEARAINKEADLFEVLSRLEQVTQAMQVTTLSQRLVLDTSLIDFLR